MKEQLRRAFTIIKVIILRLISRYQNELENYIMSLVDKELQGLNRAIDEKLREKIKNDVVYKIIEEKIDVCTNNSSDLIRATIRELLESVKEV